MAREITPDFAKRAAQTAIGEGLPSHYPVSDELPSLFHSLSARLDETDALRIAKRYPPKQTEAQNPAEPLATDAYSRVEEADRLGNPLDEHQRQNAFLARAEEVRTAAEGMHSPARETMLRLADTYQKIARHMLQSTGTVKEPADKSGDAK
jgi:hypothetical protein